MIIGYPQDFQVGGHFLAAARSLGIPCEIADVREATGSWLANKFYWHFGDHRPPNMNRFNRDVVSRARRFLPTVVLVNGIAPVLADTLRTLGEMGIARANMLTDDPFNAVHRTRWFLRTLQFYDLLLTPRRINIPDLLEAGARRAEYLPFAYNPVVHCPPSPEEPTAPACDLLFVGGADDDRVRLLAPLVGSFSLALCGGFWEKYPVTKPAARGILSSDEVRSATASARVVLVLVRRANRDEHVMRTYESAAIGGCLLVEDTRDHRQFFGENGDCVRYFDSGVSLRAEVANLTAPGSGGERRRLAAALAARMASGSNTYADRLETIFRLATTSRSR